MSQWHAIARNMLSRGEPRAYVARLFEVSEAMICKIAKAPPARAVQVPDWVKPENRRVYRILAQERGAAIAMNWAKREQGR